MKRILLVIALLGGLYGFHLYTKEQHLGRFEISDHDAELTVTLPREVLTAGEMISIVDPNGHEHRVLLPRFAGDGDRIRFKHWGVQGKGDLYLALKITDSE